MGRVVELSNFYIGLDKSGYQVSIFLISPQKHMLWVLLMSTTMYVFMEKKEKYQYFWIEKSALTRAMQFY